MSARLIALLLGLILLVAGLTVAGVQTVLLEQQELEHMSEWKSLTQLSEAKGATRISARLSEVQLSAGEQALFELCAKDELTLPRWQNAFDVVVWQPSTKRLSLRVPLDAAHLALVKRRRGRACLTLGGGNVDESGRYAMDLVWAGKSGPSPELRQVPLSARVLAKPPLGAREGALVLCAALGAMLSVFAAFSPHQGQSEARANGLLWATVGTSIAVALAALVLRAPIPGAVGGLARGLGIALVEVGIGSAGAWLLCRQLRGGLALHAPEQRAGLWLFAAVFSAAVLNPLSRWAMDVVPSTGEAPIEAFIAWPSGALAFAALGMVVPLAEELFFRGFVFGALRPFGFVAAYLGTVVLFASAHAQQGWGNWGALLSVTLTGAMLTLLRALSGSTLVPAVAHLLYNLSLWLHSFGG